jgi:hypothetical protein
MWWNITCSVLSNVWMYISEKLVWITTLVQHRILALSGSFLCTQKCSRLSGLALTIRRTRNGGINSQSSYMWITKLLAKQSWSFGHMLAGSAISILGILKMSCMISQWLIHLMIQNCITVRNCAREGWPWTLVAIFVVVRNVYVVRA